jgi:opacity protein-like surface antigen
MKNKSLLALLLTAAFALAVFAAEASAPGPTVLETKTENGITTTYAVGRVQGDYAADGTLTLTIFPTKTVTVGAVVVVSQLDTSKGFTYKLTSGQQAALSPAIVAAWVAANPPPAAPANP